MLRQTTRTARPGQRRFLARLFASTVLTGVAASGLTVATAPVAEAATPPVFPNNIVVFPQRDFVSLEGYDARAGQFATIVVTRAGVETSRAVGTVGAGDPSLEVNHPGGVCWQGVTPDIQPGDRVTVSFVGGGSDSTRTLTPEVLAVEKSGATGLVVTGKRAADVPTSQIEQRIVNPDLDDTAVGRRDVRAPARPGPYTSSLTFPTPTTFRATYQFQDNTNTPSVNEGTQMRDIAADGQARALSWQATDADDNRQGLTIAELGEVGGPGFGGCPPGPVSAVPFAPVDVAATAGDGSASVSWSPAVAAPGGAAVSGYRVTAVNVANGAAISIEAPLCSTTCGAMLPDLVNGRTYRVEVRALSASGAGAPGVAPDTVTPTGVSEPPASSVPAAPADVAATAGNASADVSWSPVVAAPVGAAVSGYRVSAVNVANDVETNLIAPVCAAGCSATVPDLVNGRTYRIEVRALSATGPSAPGVAPNTVTPAGVGEPPSLTVPAAPADVTATAGDASADVSWSPVVAAPGNATVSGYRVSAVNVASGAETSIPAPLCATSCTTTVSDLVNGRTYRIEVRALSAVGASAPGTAPNTVTPTGVGEPPSLTVPAAPADVAATAGDGSADVSWSPVVAAPGGAAVSGYRVTAVNVGNDVETSLVVPVCAAGCSASVPDLVNGRTYRIEVRALSAAGPSAPGVAPGTVIPSGVGEPPGGTVPTAPSNLAAYRGDGNKRPITARITWWAAAQPAGVTVDGWQVSAYAASTDNRIMQVFIDEPLSPRRALRARTISFAKRGLVYFKVQAVASDALSTRSPLSPRSNKVLAR
jgi:Fibronectin type III domain